MSFEPKEIDELVALASDSSSTVSVLLLKARILAKKMGDKAFEDWLTSEITALLWHERELNNEKGRTETPSETRQRFGLSHVVRPVRWVNQNKQWIFSGIGVALLGLILSYIGYIFLNRSTQNNAVNAGNGSQGKSGTDEVNKAQIGKSAKFGKAKRKAHSMLMPIATMSRPKNSLS